MSDVKAKYIITAGEGIDHERAAVVRYLRAMSEGLRCDAASAHENDEYALDADLTRQAALFDGAALDIEQGLHLDPDRLRELGVIE